MILKRIQALLSEYHDIFYKMRTARKYYENENDILDTGVNSTAVDGVKDNILRNADNRIPHAFHKLLVDEKAAYLFTYPPIIDIDDNVDINNRVGDVLGSSFARKLKSMCIEASNTGVAWCHYWIDDKGLFKYERINSDECIPIYSQTLDKELVGFIRSYSSYEYVNEDTTSKTMHTYIEYWDDTSFTKYKLKGNNDTAMEVTEVKHTFGRVPFIKFANNMQEKSDLIRYKKQIDLFDKVMSGYANDIEDIQQIIYILENYGGKDEEFIQKLKRYKTVQMANNEVEGKGDLRTLQIDIPVEARKVILEELKKQIYEFGQGLQQDVESVGNASGVALKFFYRKLELKAGDTESEFRQGIDELIRAILMYLGISATKIQQTYTRNMISNDLENAQIAQQSVGVIPQKYILQNHPWIDDVEEAERLLEEENNKREKTLEDKYMLNNEGGSNA